MNQETYFGCASPGVLRPAVHMLDAIIEGNTWFVFRVTDCGDSDGQWRTAVDIAEGYSLGRSLARKPRTVRHAASRHARPRTNKMRYGCAPPASRSRTAFHPFEPRQRAPITTVVLYFFSGSGPARVKNTAPNDALFIYQL